MDDGDDDLPAQPRAGQAARRRCSSCSASASTAPAPRRPACASGCPSAPSEPLAIADGTEVGTPRTATEESIVFQVDERFDDPGRGARRRTCSSAAARSRASASPTARPRPQGADQLAVREPARGRRRALPRLRGAARPPADRGRRRRLAGARRGREPGGPAAALGGLPGRQRVARGRGARGPHGRLQLRLGHRDAASCRRARRSSRSAGHRMHWLRCRIDDRTRDGGAATTYTQPPGDLLDHRRRRSARGCPPRTPRRSIAEIVGVSDGTPGQVFPLRNAPVLKPQTGETLEVQDPESGDWARWELRDDFVGSTEFDRHFTLGPRLGRGGVRARDPRDRRRLDPVRRRAAEGRPCCASPATGTAADAPATSPRAR